MNTKSADERDVSNPPEPSSDPRETIRKKLIIALDDLGFEQALNLSGQVVDVGALKVNSFFTECGPGGFQPLKEFAPVFLDMKFHDIPNTVRLHTRAATKQGVRLMTVHCAGGMEMMAAAMEGVRESLPKLKPWVIGITMLTSHTLETFKKMFPVKPGYSLLDMTLHMARMGCEAGLDGVVCSPQEVGPIRKELGAGFILITPGIRRAGTATHDQRRTDTPLAAIKNGADFLVIGRPVTQAPASTGGPAAEVERIIDEVVAGL